MLTWSFVVAAALIGLVGATDYSEPPPTFDPQSFTKWSKLEVKGSRRADIKIPFTNADGSADSVEMIRLDLVGDSHARGYAHGYLLAKEIVEFTGPKLNKFYIDAVMGLDIDSYPEPLHTILKIAQVKGALAAPDAIKKAMKWVWDNEEKYVPQNLITEIDAMGEGLCASPLAPADCSATEWSDNIKTLNMLPELIKMACTAYGAWGKATEKNGHGGLTQVRALDFGGGPWADNTVIQVHRDDPTSGAFVSVAFPAFAGVITGVSQSGIGVSEKVFMVTGADIPKGSYDGEADIFVLRDILQNSKSKEDAETYVQNAKRTWGIWIGIGDFKSNVLDIVGYTQANATVYTDVTTPAQTSQPYLEHIAYVDKHTQPSRDDPSLHTALSDHYGNISSETSKVITQYHKTGDVHIASYDFTANTMYVAIGKTNKDGEYRPEGGEDDSVWKAYNRPYLKFNLNDLWAGI